MINKYIWHLKSETTLHRLKAYVPSCTMGWGRGTWGEQDVREMGREKTLGPYLGVHLFPFLLTSLGNTGSRRRLFPSIP